jgi:hypothetical protein
VYVFWIHSSGGPRSWHWLVFYSGEAPSPRLHHKMVDV